MIVKRKPLTKREALEMFIAQDGLCACGCGQKLKAGEIDEQHFPHHELRKDDPDYDGKPNELWIRACHKKETKDVDMPRITKARHQAGGLGSQRAKQAKRTSPLLPARGFDKRFKKKLTGEVIPRTE